MKKGGRRLERSGVGGLRGVGEVMRGRASIKLTLFHVFGVNTDVHFE